MMIQLNGIEKKYENKVVLTGITLSLTKKFTTILGESGCGKTTLLKIIAGLLKPDEGDIWFDQRKIFSKKENINIRPNRRNVAMVFQDFALWPHMTVLENVAYSIEGKKHAVRQQAMEALQLVDLAALAERKPGELSGGQQQRVSLARAIAPKPKIILFDEALSALDAVLREKMQVDIVQLLNQTNSQAIFVTHDQEEAMMMSDEIIVMDKGKISQIGAPEEIYNQPSNQYVAHFIGKMNQLETNVFIRPEFVKNVPEEKESSKRIMQVERSQFIGQHYVIYGQVENFPWMIYAAKPIAIGTNYPIYFNKKQVTKIGGN